MNTTSRTVHPMCCTVCLGSGFTTERDSCGYPRRVPCLHTTRVDVTGLDDDTERWLALDAECDRMKEAFRRFGRHTPACLIRVMEAAGNGHDSPGCSCGFSAEWRRVFGPSTGVDSRHG